VVTAPSLSISHVGANVVITYQAPCSLPRASRALHERDGRNEPLHHCADRHPVFRAYK